MIVMMLMFSVKIIFLKMHTEREYFMIIISEITNDLLKEIYQHIMQMQ